MEDDLKKMKKMEDYLKKLKKLRRPNFFFEKLKWLPQKNGRWPKKNEKNGRRPKKIKNGKRTKQKWKTNQSTKINLIRCDTIVNSPSFILF